jgi:hypothetical protein
MMQKYSFAPMVVGVTEAVTEVVSSFSAIGRRNCNNDYWKSFSTRHKEVEKDRALHVLIHKSAPLLRGILANP